MFIQGESALPLEAVFPPAGIKAEMLQGYKTLQFLLAGQGL